MFSGAAFVRKEVRAGVLPSILAALMSARSATRATLKGVTDPTQRAILDSRQKALKLMANALYGFTGETDQTQTSGDYMVPVHNLLCICTLF
jgi:DNA polymerase delta subunit 1